MLLSLGNQLNYLIIPNALIIFSFFIHSTTADTCEIQSPCSCKTSNGAEVSLESFNSVTPLINDESNGKTPVEFSYNPCRTFTEPPGSTNTQCVSVTACMNDNATYTDIGKLESASFSGDPMKNQLVVSYKSADTQRTTHVRLICGASVVYEVDGEVAPNVYNFSLVTPDACVMKDGGLSTGSVLIIIFLILVIIYLVVGILYMRFVSGARGWEQIPNYDFWQDFPLLVKDGITFATSGCKSETTYEQI